MRFSLLPLFLVACDALPDLVPGELTTSFHPCDGSRTDTLWRDADGTLWLGCGEAALGTGLYTSDDDGADWRSVMGFDEFRVSDISRAGDGLLYIAGTEVGGDDRIRSLDGATIASVHVATNQLWNTFHVGTFRRQDSGLAISESLTGSGMATRADDDSPWMDADPWVNGGYQMLDLMDDDGTLLGAGSTIAQPHTVFVQEPGLPSFTAVTLDDSFTGELWAIAGNNGRYVAAGVDQDSDEAVLWTTSGDPTDPAAWTAYRQVGTDPTWFRDVCRNGDRIVAVGEYSRRNDGLLVESTDGGATFETTSLPEGTPGIYNCVLDGDDLYLAGGDGYFARR